MVLEWLQIGWIEGIGGFWWVKPSSVLKKNNPNAPTNQSVVDTSTTPRTDILAQQNITTTAQPSGFINSTAKTSTLLDRQIEDIQKKAPKFNINHSAWFGGIQWVNKPTVWSQFADPNWAAQTETQNFPSDVKSAISQQMNLSAATPTVAQPTQPVQAVDMQQPLLDLWATIKANKYTPEELQSKFPEFANLDKQTFLDLWATINASPDITPDEILQKFPEISWPQADELAWAPWIVKAWYWLIEKGQKYDGFWSSVVNGIANFFWGLLAWGDETGEGLKNIFERGKTVNEQAVKSDIVMSKFKEQYGRLPNMSNEYDKNLVTALSKDIESDPKFSEVLQQKKSEQEAIDVVPLQKSILDVAEWGFSTALNIVAPTVMVGLWIANETQVWSAVLWWLWSIISFWWKIINFLPWLKQFRDSLSDEDKARMDSLVWNAATLFLAWSKYKGESIKDPVKFVSDNINPADIISTFKGRAATAVENVVNAPNKIIEWVKNFKPTELIKKTTEWVDNVDRIASNVFGLDAETVSAMRKYPDLFKKIDEWTLSKESIKEDLLNMVDELQNQKWDVGKEYKNLYEQGNTFSTPEIETTLQSNLKDKWVVFEGNQIKSFDITNKALANTPQWELNLIKSQYNLIMESLADKNTLSIEQLHNIKRTLGNAQYTEWVMTKKSPILKEMSNVVNSKLSEVKWRKETDTKFSTKSKELKELADVVVTKKWEFKWTLKALLWERQYGRLQELEKSYPWLTNKLEAIKAYDDYIKTRETKKVWLYNSPLKSLAWGWIWAWIWYAIGWTMWSYLWWFLGSLITNHLTDPKVFKDFIIKNVEDGSKIITKIEAGKKLTPQEQENIKKVLVDKKWWDANISSNQPDPTVIDNKPTQGGQKTTQEGIQNKGEPKLWWVTPDSTAPLSNLSDASTADVGITSVKWFKEQGIDKLVDSGKKLESKWDYEAAQQKFDQSISLGKQKLDLELWNSIESMEWTFGRYFWESEPTISLKLKNVNDATIDNLVKISKKSFKQKSFFVAEKIDWSAKPWIIDKKLWLSNEPWVIIYTKNKIGLENLKDLDIIFQELEIPWATILLNGEWIKIYNLSAFNTNYGKFKQQVWGLVKRLQWNDVLWGIKWFEQNVFRIRHLWINEWEALWTYKNWSSRSADSSKITKIAPKSEGLWNLWKTISAKTSVEDLIKNPPKTKELAIQEVKKIPQDKIDSFYKDYIKENEARHWKSEANVIDSDTIKRIIGKDPKMHELSSALSDRLLEVAIKNDKSGVVKFTGGWSASGKSEMIVRKLKEKPWVIFDGTLSDIKSFDKRYELAKKYWKRVEIDAVYANPKFAKQLNDMRNAGWSQNVSVDILRENHKKFRDTIYQIRKKYPDIPINIKVNRWFGQKWKWIYPANVDDFIKKYRII